MPKINHIRQKKNKWKQRIPINKPTRIIELDSIYNRSKIRNKLRKKLKDYEGIIDKKNLGI